MKDASRIWTGITLLLALVVVALIHAAGCGNAYLSAYRGIATARATAATTEQALADVCQVKRVTCLEAHGPATPAYAACTDPCRKALVAWTTYTRPSVNSALVAAVGAVSAAEAAKLKAPLADILRPVACALGRGMEQWIALLPVSIRATVEAVARGVAGYVCPKEVP